jgi:hypothetical protein
VGDAESGVDAGSRLRSFFVERSVLENFAILGTGAVGRTRGAQTESVGNYRPVGGWVQ